MQFSTHVYKILKSSWGIRISITAGVQFETGQEKERVAAGYPVWLRFTDSASDLPPAYKEEATKGLSMVAAEISESINGRTVTVTVGEVSYVESDFQIDGISVAMCRWAEDMFEIHGRQIIASFDREANRYHFEWH
ncbi:hypothetical protein [Streptomyces sp. NBC_01264]|uniref:hypothetical protein n=1 Tax=Streptomyces sp. NBC_01264 TaxID=2903804 RepID=UPI00224FFD64|nr:hypothetical protein [Streptomyces sp. NBC_01264]MCX4784252.1 hypothetical protein [Streptomyces sp. NBC_01264]